MVPKTAAKKAKWASTHYSIIHIIIIPSGYVQSCQKFKESYQILTQQNDDIVEMGPNLWVGVINIISFLWTRQLQYNVIFIWCPFSSSCVVLLYVLYHSIKRQHYLHIHKVFDNNILLEICITRKNKPNYYYVVIYIKKKSIPCLTKKKEEISD